MSDTGDAGRSAVHPSSGGMPRGSEFSSSRPRTQGNRQARSNRRAAHLRSKQQENGIASASTPPAPAATRGRVAVQIKSKARDHLKGLIDQELKASTLPRTHRRSNRMRLYQSTSPCDARGRHDVINNEDNTSDSVRGCSDDEQQEDQQNMSFSDALSKWRSKEQDATLGKPKGKSKEGEKPVESDVLSTQAYITRRDTSERDAAVNKAVVDALTTNEGQRLPRNATALSNHNNNSSGESRVHNHNNNSNTSSSNNSINSSHSQCDVFLGLLKRPSSSSAAKQQQSPTVNIGCNPEDNNNNEVRALLSNDTKGDISPSLLPHSKLNNGQEVEQFTHRQDRNFRSSAERSDGLRIADEFEPSGHRLADNLVNGRLSRPGTTPSQTRLAVDNHRSAFESQQDGEISDRVKHKHRLQREKIRAEGESQDCRVAEAEVTLCQTEKGQAKSGCDRTSPVVRELPTDSRTLIEPANRNDRDVNHQVVVNKKAGWSSTDSESEFSTGLEEFHETDSSTVEEQDRRRRRIKRTRKDGCLAPRVTTHKKRASKSWHSQHQRSDICTVDSTSDDYGTASRNSSFDFSATDEIVSTDTTLSGLHEADAMSGPAIYKLNRPTALQRDTKAPPVRRSSLAEHRSTGQFRGSSSSPMSPQPMLSSSLTSFSNVNSGLKSDHDNSSGVSRPFGVGVSRVAKITIPALQRNALTPQLTRRHFSDSESLASSSAGDISSLRPSTLHQSKLQPKPAASSQTRVRDVDEPLSDGEQEKQTRLNNLEKQHGQFLDNGYTFRRSNTLPRKLTSKGESKVKVNPFQLKVNSRRKVSDSGSDTARNDVNSDSSYSSEHGTNENKEDLSATAIARSPQRRASANRSYAEISATEFVNNGARANNDDNGATSRLLSTKQQGPDRQDSSSSSGSSTRTVKAAILEYESSTSDADSQRFLSSSLPSSMKMPSRATKALEGKTKTFYANQTTKLMHDLEKELASVSREERHVNEEATCPVLDPPDNFKDNPKAQLPETPVGKVTVTSPDGVSTAVDADVPAVVTPVTRRRSRPLNLPTAVIRKHDSLTDVTESPTRRASYIKAQRSMVPGLLRDEIPRVPPPPSYIETDILDDTESSRPVDDYEVLLRAIKEKNETNVRKTSLRSRPKLPLSLGEDKTSELVDSAALKLATHHHKQTSLSSAEREGSPPPPTELTIDEADDEEDTTKGGLSPDLAKTDKSDSVNKQRRARPTLAALCVLEDIPEEKGHVTVKTGPKDTAEVANRIKKRKAKIQVPPTPGAVPPADQHVLERPDSCESGIKDDRSETGYCSQSSDLLSTPSQLSFDDISQESIDAADMFSRADAFKSLSQQQIVGGGKPLESNDAMRSRSDPMPGNLSEGDARLIANTIMDRDMSGSWASNSEPNLSRDKLNKMPTTTNGQQNDTKKKGSGRSRKSSTGTEPSEPSTPCGQDGGFDSAFESPTLTIQPASPITHKSSSIKSLSTPVSPDSPFPPIKQIKGKHDMRRHVLQNLLETEKSYVQNLSSLVTMYYKPLKRPDSAMVIEPSLVDEIFFQIPEILVNHEFFLEQLTNRVGDWHERQVIGDIFVSSFTKCLLMDAYSTFINHYLQARAAIRQGTLQRPTFGKFLEQCCKDHREKLTLQDLMIMPVQRIPRYALILKDMLKHTPVDHPDHGNLQLALGEIKTLADRMNKGEIEADQAEREAEKLRDIEATIENMSDLVSTHRKFIRQDLVAEMKGMITKKDRCIFLFSDLLVCATVRRKNHALRRGSLGLFSGQSATEFNKYKLLWRLRLEDVDIVKNSATHSSPSKRGGNEKHVEKLEEDMSTLRNIASLADSLTAQHQNLDAGVRELMSELSKQIAEKSQVTQPMPSVLTRIELQAQTEDGIEYFLFVFLSAEIKSSWEAYFEDAKQKLAYSKDSFPPEFQFPMPITKTRSGMQFTCAAPCHVTSHGDVACDAIRGEVWVCNSDGYVGQVCLLSMVPDAQPKTCLSVCSARIQCISPVPGARLLPGPRSPKPSIAETRRLPGIPEDRANKKAKAAAKSQLPPLKAKKSISCDSDDDDMSHGAESIIAFDSSDEDDNDIAPSYIGGPAVYGGRMSPDGSSLGTVESVEGDHDSSSNNEADDYRANDSSDDDDPSPSEPTRRISMPMGSALSRGTHGYTLKGSLDDLLTNDADDQSTMWLGTEDGSIYVYQANDAASMRKSKMKMQLGAAVNAIVYFDNKVFVALASGELCVYKRDPGSGWEVAAPQTIQVAQSGSPISCITVVAGRIWCGCQNNLVLVNAVTLRIEATISVSQDHHRSVYRIASSGLGVWVSLQSSAVVKLYHATTHECLTDIDVAPAVHKMLAGADAIIRQHKAACLRVTALLTCKDLLWIGTSAGVILTNPLPTITISTQSLRNAPGPSGSPHGHTGHVRFLTVVDVPRHIYEQNYNNNNNNNTNSSDMQPKGKVTAGKDRKIPRKSLDSSADNVTLVIGGGDGYEDFRTSATSESVGRDDSTNHLLVWRV